MGRYNMVLNVRRDDTGHGIITVTDASYGSAQFGKQNVQVQETVEFIERHPKPVDTDLVEDHATTYHAMNLIVDRGANLLCRDEYGRTFEVVLPRMDVPVVPEYGEMFLHPWEEDDGDPAFYDMLERVTYDPADPEIPPEPPPVPPEPPPETHPASHTITPFEWCSDVATYNLDGCGTITRHCTNKMVDIGLILCSQVNQMTFCSRNNDYDVIITVYRPRFGPHSNNDPNLRDAAIGGEDSLDTPSQNFGHSRSDLQKDGESTKSNDATDLAPTSKIKNHESIGNLFVMRTRARRAKLTRTVDCSNGEPTNLVVTEENYGVTRREKIESARLTKSASRTYENSKFHSARRTRGNKSYRHSSTDNSDRSPAHKAVDLSDSSTIIYGPYDKFAALSTSIRTTVLDLASSVDHDLRGPEVILLGSACMLAAQPWQLYIVQYQAVSARSTQTSTQSRFSLIGFQRNVLLLCSTMTSTHCTQDRIARSTVIDSTNSTVCIKLIRNVEKFWLSLDALFYELRTPQRMNSISEKQRSYS